jgi:ferredoxin
MLAPEVFDADEDGHCLVRDLDVSPEHHDAARRGAANCPEDAITVEE